MRAVVPLRRKVHRPSMHLRARCTDAVRPPAPATPKRRRKRRTPEAGSIAPSCDIQPGAPVASPGSPHTPNPGPHFRPLHQAQRCEFPGFVRHTQPTGELGAAGGRRGGGTPVATRHAAPLPHPPARPPAQRRRGEEARSLQRACGALRAARAFAMFRVANG